MFTSCQLFLTIVDKGVLTLGIACDRITIKRGEHMKKYKTKKHLSLDIAMNETWSQNHKKKSRTYNNTKNTWRKDLEAIGDEQRKQKLFQYALEGNKKMVRVLYEDVKDKFDLNFYDKDGNNLLMYAIKGGNIETVRYLVSRGIETDYVNALGLTPLHLAVRKNRMDLTAALVDGGADINIVGKNNEGPIFDAVKEGNAKMVEALYLNGAQINHKNDRGETPLHVATKDPRRQEVLLVLLALGANIEEGNNRGQTPLIYAIINENNPLIDILLKRGANMNHADAENNTPIMYCAKSGNREALRVLIARGADFLKYNNNGDRALNIALKNDYKTCAEILAKAERIMSSDLNSLQKKQELFKFATHNKVTNSCAR